MFRRLYHTYRTKGDLNVKCSGSILVRSLDALISKKLAGTVPKYCFCTYKTQPLTKTSTPETQNTNADSHTTEVFYTLEKSEMNACWERQECQS